MSVESGESVLLPHHEQQSLCTTRLPYRQGKKLTAVKVYSINNESKHLLVFGVPSLNIRQETKFLFLKFGKLLQFNLTKYPSEQFTETYHAVYESIQSARIAKKMLDTKNFYGGSLHIVYAPELETIEETRDKILLRQKNVIARLRNLERDKNTPKSSNTQEKPVDSLEDIPKSFSTLENSEKFASERTNNKLFMGEINSFKFGKRQFTDYKSVKRMKHASKSLSKGDARIKIKEDADATKNDIPSNIVSDATDSKSDASDNISKLDANTLNDVEVIDITSASKEIVTNINETLNYDNFGNELIRKVPYKPVNKIKFNLNKK